MPYNLNDLLELISVIREHGEITIRRDSYLFESAGYSAMVNDFRSISKHAGFNFIEEVLEPGVIWMQVSPSQREQLRYGASLKSRSGN